jgi:hypothetical protein
MVCRRLEIGFDWLCSFRPHRLVYYHNLLSQKTLRQFERGQIGFVFSNWVLLDAFISDFELSASDFRPKAGDWLCFFKMSLAAPRFPTNSAPFALELFTFALFLLFDIRYSPAPF